MPSFLPLMANPSGGTVAGGSVTIASGPGGTVTVNQSSQKAVVNWQNFSIQQGETTTFVQPNSSSATLNRVTGGQMSQIQGTLNANGKVYLINPQGVVIGKTGRVNTGGGFTASTLDVSDQEFLAGKGMTFKGSSSASVVNQGKIKAVNGDVMLIARQVDNQGKITARNGEVHLAGGQEVLVQPSGTAGQRVFIRGGTGSVANSGTIRATAAELRAAGGNEYALAVNNTGVIRATGVDKSGGRIVLKAETGGGDGSALVPKNSGKVQNSGKLIAKAKAPGKNGGQIVVTGERVTIATGSLVDASGQRDQRDAGLSTGGGNGGTVRIGGGFQGNDSSIANAKVTVVEQGASIVADGGTKGGSVVIWSDKATGFYGSISTKGAPNDPDANYGSPQTPEESAASTGPGGFVEVSSRNYLEYRGLVETGGGTLLLDPSNITIIAGSGTTNLTAGPDFVSTAATSTIGATDIITLLNAGTSVIIRTSNSFHDSSGLQTTITGDNTSGDISVEASLGWVSTASLTLLAHDDIIVLGSIINSGTGALSLVGGWSTSSTDVNTIRTSGNYGYYGNLQNSAGFVSNNGGSVFIGSPTSSTVSRIASAGGGVNVMGYNVVVQGGNATNAFSQIGSRISTGAGSTITINYNGLVSVLGGTGDGSYALIGHGGPSLSPNLDFGGDISITGVDGLGPGTRGVNLVGGTGPRSFAQIGHNRSNVGPGTGTTSGNITIQGFLGDINLTARNTTSWAQIGHGGGGTGAGSISGDITIAPDNGLPGPASLLLGNGVQLGWLMVGHGGGGYVTSSSTSVYTDVGGTVSGNISLSNLLSVELFDSPSGTFAFTQIGHGGYNSTLRNVTGNISITAPRFVSNITLTAGGGDNNYSQIGHLGGGSTTGAANVQARGSINITGYSRLTLNGATGTAQNAYTQIGHGGAGTVDNRAMHGVFIGTSDITITGPATGLSVILNGSAGLNDYAQIGHGGSQRSGDFLVADVSLRNLTSLSMTGGAGGQAYSLIGNHQLLTSNSISGDITIAGIASGATFSLTGGTGASAEAHIGHGEAFFQAPQVLGDISITNSSTLTMTARPTSSVQIGHGGSSSLKVVSGSVKGGITIAGIGGPGTTVTLNGSDSGNTFAQIGHGGYDTASGTNTMDAYGAITISAATIQLTGGVASGISQAQIGHGGILSHLNTSTTDSVYLPNIVLNLTTLTMNGTIGFAQVGNGGRNASGSYRGDITMNFTGTGSTMDLLAGSGLVQVGNGGLGYNSPAGILSGNILVNNVATINVKGDTYYSQIGAGGHSSASNQISGNITLNMIAGGGTLNVFAGSANNNAYAQIGHGGYSANSQNVSGNIEINNASTVDMRAGSGTSTYAQIGHGGVSFTLSGNSVLTGSVSLLNASNPTAATLTMGVLGGTGDKGYTQIGHGGYGFMVSNNTGVDGAIELTNVAQLTMNGGTSIGRYALIGHGGYTTSTGSYGTLSGAVSISGNDTAIIRLNGSSGSPFGYTQIGHGGNGAMSQASGAITISKVSQLELLSGSGNGGFAHIGHGGFSIANVRGFSGDIAVSANIIALNAADGFAQIGHGGAGINAYEDFSGKITITDVSSLNIQGGTTGHYALIGHGGTALNANSSPNDATTVLMGLVGDISITGTSGASSLSMSNRVSANSSFSQIGHGGIGTPVSTYSLINHISGNIDVTGFGGISMTVRGQYDNVRIGHGGSYLSIKNAGGISGNITVTGTGTGVLSMSYADIANYKLAQIGHGGSTSYINNTISGTIEISNFNVITLNGGLGTADFVQIGHGGYDIRDFVGSPISITNAAITVEDIEALYLTGGSGQGSFATIGHGGYASPIRSITAPITISGTGSSPLFISMVISGNALNSFSSIGHTTNGSVDGDILIEDASSVMLINNSFSGSVRIGHVANSTAVYARGKIDINGVAASGMTVNLQSSSTGPAQIGHRGNLSGDMTGDISITNISGSGGVDGLKMQGGGNNGYIQIGHSGSFSGSDGATGNISLSRAAGSTTFNVNMDGGTGTSSYVLIGHSNGSSSVPLTGSITLDGVAGLDLQGGGGMNDFAQIGHGGTFILHNTSTITGRIVLTGIGAASNPLNVIAGSGSLSYAMIGHGGTGNNGMLIDGDISITGFTSMALTGGGNNSTYAQIGHGGYYSTFQGTTATSNIVITMTGTTGSMSLSGGGGADSYAVIGHSGRAAGNYQGGITLTGASSATSALQVVGGAGPNAFAKIGHGGSQGDGSTVINANGAIGVSGFTGITLKTGTNDNAYAHIGHGGARLLLGTIGGAITLTDIGDISLMAGGNNTFAMIGHGGSWNNLGTPTFSGDISITVKDGATISLTNNTTSGNGFVQIGNGGTNATAISISGNISLGTASAAAPFTLNMTGAASSTALTLIGHGGASSNPSSLGAISGDITLTNAGKVVMYSIGTAPTQIGHAVQGSSANYLAGNITLTGINDLELYGYNPGIPTIGGYAQIGHGGYFGTVATTIMGNITIRAGIAPTLLQLKGGSSSSTYAQIGHGGAFFDNLSGIGVVNSDISISGLFPVVNLVAGSNGPAQIGHGGASNAISVTNSNITLNIPSASLTLEGSTNASSSFGYAMIGNGGVASTFTPINTLSGNIWIVANKLDLLTTAPDGKTFAQIGNGGAVVMDPAGSKISGRITLDITGETSVENRGGGSYLSMPWIGHYAANSGGVAANSDVLLRTALLDYTITTSDSTTQINGLFTLYNLPYILGNGNVTIVSGSNLEYLSAVNAGFTPYALSLLSKGNVTVGPLSHFGFGTGGIDLVAGYDGTSGILNGGDPNAGPTTDRAGFRARSTALKDITFQNGATFNLSSGSFNLVAGRSIIFEAGSSITDPLGDILILTDNYNATRPAMGTATSFFRNNGTITGNRVSVYAVGPDNVTLGNLSSLAVKNSIWYGDAGAINPGINYKIATVIPPVDPPVIPPVDPPVIPPVDPPVVPPSDSGPETSFTFDFGRFDSTFDQSDEILKRRYVFPSGYTISYASGSSLVPADSIFSLSSYNLHLTPQQHSINPGR
ncbi:MAG: filamentous hemagglutinin N-terminal domain-containing protein [Candidatus Methylacidiphilales bacterium]